MKPASQRCLGGRNGCATAENQTLYSPGPAGSFDFAQNKAGIALAPDRKIERWPARQSDGSVVDLASGRCYLVEEMARRLERPVVATDFSPRVLKQGRRRLESFGLYDKISLLAFDVRRTPFEDGAVRTLTTNVGLSNVAAPGDLLKELRRVAAGQFLAISHFYAEEDEVNAAALREAGLSSLIFRDAAVEAFIAAGWEVEVANECRARAEPTPKSEVLGGAQIDAFPVQETMLEWCVLVAQCGDKERNR